MFVRFLCYAISSFALLTVLFLSSADAGVVSIKNNQLYIDGAAQPQLYGAEVQYFRLRGGPDRNVPRADVMALWEKTLDRFVEAKMNMISFYIPWDFHEYAQGKFDFDGTVDEDGDGLADYPSRDVRTWFKMIKARGIKHVMARPGPYINAEWGFLGFGAVPLWFHERYPQAHAVNPLGQKTVVYSYHSPEFLQASKRWLRTVYRELLREHIGPNKPVSFLQIDNETNYQWSSIFRHDYGPRAIARYQDSLRKTYRDSLSRVNRAHGRNWQKFSEIKPPTKPEQNIAEDQDWYRFQDQTIHTYLSEIRNAWEEIGVREPTVLFTLAESYNAPEDGILPHYQWRNDPGRTGMMTVNLYPKTSNGEINPLLNNPFKADHDVKAADSASDYYLGRREEWVMGPEIQGGWWRGTDVTIDSRRQTYLTTLGHGLKALLVYYFNEGENWQNDWALKQVQPYYDRLRLDPRFKSIDAKSLPEIFWSELNAVFAEEQLAGWDVRWIMANGGTQPKQLYFDAAVGGDGEPRKPFQLLREIGEKIIAPHSEFLGSAAAITDPVCLIKDSAAHAPSKIDGLNSLQVNADWSAALNAYLMHAGLNAKILHWGLTPETEYANCQLFVYQDNGFANSDLLEMLTQALARGAGVVSFLHDGAFQILAGRDLKACHIISDTRVPFEGKSCKIGREGGRVYHVKQPIYEALNSDRYGQMTDIPLRRKFIEDVIKDLKISPTIQINRALAAQGDHVVAFGRQSPDQKRIWITMKNGQATSQTLRVRWSGAQTRQMYDVQKVLAGTSARYSGHELIESGFAADLLENGSEAFLISEVP